MPKLINQYLDDQFWSSPAFDLVSLPSSLEKKTVKITEKKTEKIPDKNNFRETLPVELLESNLGFHGFFTSGSSRFPKLVVHSKEGILKSAQLVSQIFELGPESVVYQSLSLSHVGGVSLAARTYCSGAQWHPTIGQKWSAKHFYSILEEKKVTHASIVPTQAFDLMSLNRQAPKYLKCLWLGGGECRLDVLNLLWQNNWPIVPTYGMTETASQVAAMENFQDFRPRTQLEFNLFPGWSFLEECSEIMGPSLCCQIWEYSQSHQCWELIAEPQKNSCLKLSDQIIQGQNSEVFRVLGRLDRRVKVLGTLVNLDTLEKVFLEMLIKSPIAPESGDFPVLMAQKDERLEHRVVLVAEKNCGSFREFIESFNAQVSGAERIRGEIFVDKIPKTELSKPRFAELQKLIDLK